MAEGVDWFLLCWEQGRGVVRAIVVGSCFSSGLCIVASIGGSSSESGVYLWSTMLLL